MLNLSNKIDIEAVDKEINQICSELQGQELKLQAAYIRDDVMDPDTASTNVLVLRDLLTHLKNQFAVKEDFSEDLKNLFSWVVYKSEETLNLYTPLNPNMAGEFAAHELEVRNYYVSKLARIQQTLNDLM